MINLYVGYDKNEDEAAKVCAYSVKKNCSVAVNINFLKINELRKDKNLYYREDDKLGSTEFTFTRFLIPFLSKHKGWSIFCDCDFLWIDDIAKLYALKNNKYAVMCVKHDYLPNNKMKMHGTAQNLYPRKNWSSMVLWNNEHESNKKLTINDVNTKDGKYLHRFGWLVDYEIGDIDYSWNWLVGWYKQTDDLKPKAIHFTEGGPWHKGYENCEFSDIFNVYKREYYLNQKI
jgi:hypothetical protein